MARSGTEQGNPYYLEKTWIVWGTLEEDWKISPLKKDIADTESVYWVFRNTSLVFLQAFSILALCSFVLES